MSNKKLDTKGGQKRNTRAPKSTVELNSLIDWLAGQNIGVARRAVHVNGRPAQAEVPTAIVTVDLGQGLKQNRLTPDQSQELGRRLRLVAAEVLGRDANFSVRADNSHGVHWVALAQ